MTARSSRAEVRGKQDRYVPDLRQLGALNEANYRRVTKLVRYCADDEAQVVELFNGGRYLGTVSLQVLEQARYTDTLILRQIHNGGKWLNDPEFTVRVYHDVRMAEVISCYRFRRIGGHHVYPNRFMHHPDEKVQINAFLADWLDFCLRFGHQPLKPSDFSEFR